LWLLSRRRFYILP